MLPTLFTLVVPASLAKLFAFGLALLLSVGRALLYQRAAGRKHRVSFLQALWDDKVMVAIFLGAAVAVWRMGLLDRPIRLPLHTYGLMIAAAFLLGIFLAQKEARRQGLDADRIGDLAFWILVAALVGSRVYFILVNWDDYFGDGLGRALPRILAFWEGGLVFYGGFIGAALTAFWYMRKHRMGFLRHADAIIPSVAVGHFLGRIGCFAAGCCWGRVGHGDHAWLARFPPGSLAYQSFAGRHDAEHFLTPDRLTTLPLHPTQLYESLGELGLFFVLVLLVRPRKRFHGEVLGAWLVLYAVLRYVVELFRGDVERGVIAGLGVGAWTSIIIFAAGVVVMLLGRRAAQASAAAVAA
jgi:phosphatidylglycerol---prolipoprotein diacylglyceryl transferase